MLAKEMAVFEAAQRALDAQLEALRSVGLRTAFEGLVVRDPSPGGERNSEISILIYEGDQLVDALEFFVVESGRLCVTPEQADQWVQQELRRVVEARV